MKKSKKILHQKKILHEHKFTKYSSNLKLKPKPAPKATNITHEKENLKKTNYTS